MSCNRFLSTDSMKKSISSEANSHPVKKLLDLYGIRRFIA
jgi:hypothetical protein